MYDVKVGFTYYDIYYVYDYTFVFLMSLLSIYGDMRLYMYIAQVNLKRESWVVSLWYNVN